MGLQYATTAGTVTAPVPAPTDEGGTIHQTSSVSTAAVKNAVEALAADSQLTQEVTDICARLIQSWKGLSSPVLVTPRGALLVLYTVCKRMLADANDLTAERDYTP